MPTTVLSQFSAPGHVYFAFDIPHVCPYFLFMESVFDPLKFYDDLKAADVPDRQARAQAEAMRNAFAAYDSSRMKELATRGDLRETELRLQKEILELENRLENKIESNKHEMLKWLIALLLTQSAFLVAIFAYLK